MSGPLKDPHEAPPADLDAAGARAYEELVLSLVTGGFGPGPESPHRVDSVRLDGTRPDTVVVIRYRDRGDPPRLLEARERIWDAEIYVRPDGSRVLEPAASTASTIIGGLGAGEYEPVEVRPD